MEERKFRPSKNFLFRLSKSELENIKRIFDYFDDGCDGSISIDDFPTALRATGLLINNAEMEDVIYEADPNSTGAVTITTFFIIVARKFRDAGEIVKTTESAFNKIYVAPATDKSVEKKIPLTSVFRGAVIARGGEPLTEAQIDEFIRQVPPTLIDKENNIKISDLVSVVMADLPPIETCEISKNDEESPAPDKTEEIKEEEDKKGEDTQPPKKGFFSFLFKKKEPQEKPENTAENKDDK